MVISDINIVRFGGFLGGFSFLLFLFFRSVLLELVMFERRDLGGAVRLVLLLRCGSWIMDSFIIVVVFLAALAAM